MKTEVVKYTCDVCGKELTEKEVFKNIYYPLIFTSNQQDGASSKSYIENKRIGLCNECANKNTYDSRQWRDGTRYFAN